MVHVRILELFQILKHLGLCSSGHRVQQHLAVKLDQCYTLEVNNISHNPRMNMWNYQIEDTYTWAAVERGTTCGQSYFFNSSSYSSHFIPDNPWFFLFSYFFCFNGKIHLLVFHMEHYGGPLTEWYISRQQMCRSNQTTAGQCISSNVMYSVKAAYSSLI